MGRLFRLLRSQPAWKKMIRDESIAALGRTARGFVDLSARDKPR